MTSLRKLLWNPGNRASLLERAAMSGFDYFSILDGICQ